MALINKILNRFGIQLNKTDSLINEKCYYENTIERVANFYVDFYNQSENLNDGILGLVFSKDRAMQLHALLSSYFYYTKNYVPLSVIFTCSNELHREAYSILKNELNEFPISFIEESDFAAQLKNLIKENENSRVFFMTDDGIFLEHFDLLDCLQFHPINNIFSLRLGADFDFCFPHNREQAIPSFSDLDLNEKKFKTWKWSDMLDSPDWSYPLSVDATIFLKREIEILLENISFKSPNSLESQMQLYSQLFIYRTGICYSKTKYVNVPCNLVQNEYANISTGAFSTNELLEKFIKGQRIDWRKLERLKPRIVQNVKYSFTK
jgi:hypothetical protein